MKNKLICLALCMVAIAASVTLFVNVINSDAPQTNVISHDSDKNHDITLPTSPAKNDGVELSEAGVRDFADTVEKYFDSVAYGTQVKDGVDASYIEENSGKTADWLKSCGKTNEAEFYSELALALSTSKGFTSDDAFSKSVSSLLTRLDGIYKKSSSDLLPFLDTSASGCVTLTLLSIYDEALKASQGSDYYTVTVGGEMLLGDKLSSVNTFKSYLDNTDYSFPLYKVSSLFKSSDLSLATLTAPLTNTLTSASGVLDPVKGQPSYAKLLTGITGVSLTSQVESNYGSAGYSDTVQALSENGISYSANGASCAIDSSFGHIVYISFDLSGLPVTTAQNEKNKAVISAAVESEKEKGADLVVVMLNYDTRLRTSDSISSSYKGTETSVYEPHFDAFNRQIGEAAIDAGADLVVGTGSKVIQGIKEYKGKYIVCSLGTLTDSTVESGHTNTQYSFLFRQTFTRENGVVKSSGVRIIPIVNTSEEEPFLPTPVLDASADEIIDILEYESRYFSDPIKNYSYIKITK